MEIGIIPFFLCLILSNENVTAAQYSDSANTESDSTPASQSTYSNKNSYSVISEVISKAVNEESGSGGSCNDDLACLAAAADHDRVGLEAIQSLHKQLDDDDNGNVDLSESDDFLREELKYASGYERRQKAFHYNDDMHISVRELWEAWLRSEVHNWTVEQTSEWLAQNVELPQYVNTFIKHRVTGATLPRLAVNNMNYVSTVLGIKDPIHKQKIALKAMDVVLFGPPKDSGNRWKDLTLIALLVSAIGGCWYAYQQNKNARKHLKRMAQDMEGLHKAEVALEDLQKELERARMEQENVNTEKLNLERRLLETPQLPITGSDLEVQKLKQENEMLRMKLSQAEGELEDRCWAAPQGLQAWLQLTHELEHKTHLKKRLNAEKQLSQARDACEKLRKKRSSLVGAFVSTHGKSIDDVDRSIVEARNALSEVTNELQERVQRWKQIESICGFNIINNNGLQYLEGFLYKCGSSTKGLRGRVSGSQDDLDEEGSLSLGGHGWVEESSGSEEAESICTEPSRQTTPSQIIPSAPAQFIVGSGEGANWTGEECSTNGALLGTAKSTPMLVSAAIRPTVSKPPLKKPIQTRTSDVVSLKAQRTARLVSSGSEGMVRSYSADLGMPLDKELIEKDAPEIRQSSAADEETYSTDSSIVDEEIKRRRNKIHFPFSKKSKSKQL